MTGFMKGMTEVERVQYTTENGYVSAGKAYLNVDKIVYMEPCKVSLKSGNYEIMRVHLSDNSTIDVSKESGRHLVLSLVSIF